MSARKRSESSTKKPLVNYIREAFRLPANLVFLTVGAGATIAAGILEYNGIPFVPWQTVALGAGGLEMLYLGFASRHPRLIRLANSKSHAQRREIDVQLKSMRYIGELDNDALERYFALYRKKNHIARNLEERSTTTGFFLENQVNKLDLLEAYYLELMTNAKRYRQHLDKSSIDAFEMELAKLREERQQNEGRAAKLLDRRISLQQKRLAKHEQLTEYAKLAELQLDTIDDTLDYLLDHSLALMEPNEISETIDSMVQEAEHHHETAQELERVYGMLSPLDEDALQVLDDAADYTSRARS